MQIIDLKGHDVLIKYDIPTRQNVMKKAQNGGNNGREKYARGIAKSRSIN